MNVIKNLAHLYLKKIKIFILKFIKNKIVLVSINFELSSFIFNKINQLFFYKILISIF